MKTIKEIPFNDIFSSAVEVYVDHLGPLVRLSVLGSVPMFLVEVFSKSYNPAVSALASLLVPVAMGVWLFFFLTVLGSVSLYAKGKEVSFAQLTAGVWERFARALGVSLLVVLFFVLGIILLVLPSFYVAVTCTFVLCAVLFENKGVIDAFKRSRELTEGVFWKMLGAHALMLLLIVVVILPMGIAFNWIGVPTVVAAFVRYAVGAFMLPLIVAFYYFLFVDLKQQKDDSMKIAVYAKDNKA